MRSREIAALIKFVEKKYGAISLYGSSEEEEHGTCFWVPGAPATLSAHTQDGGLPAGIYDIQIEGQPPGEYVYTAIVPLHQVLDFIERLQGPEDQWPLSPNSYLWTTLGTGLKPKGTRRRIFEMILRLFIPMANPGYEPKLHLVKEWLIEFDPEGYPTREVGLDQAGNVLLAGPNDRDYGFWDHSRVRLEDLDGEPIRQAAFEEYWEKSAGYRNNVA